MLMRVTARVWSLFLGRVVSTNPLYVNPALRCDLVRGRGVPTETTILMFEGGMVVWEPDGEVRTVR